MRTPNPPRLLLLGLAFSLALGAAACGASAPDPDVATVTPIAAAAGDSGGASDAGGAGQGATAAPTATKEPVDTSALAGDSAAAGLPEDVPVLANAEKLVVTGDASYISYEAASTVDEATVFYQEQLLAAGWEQKSKKDSGFGDSITLLREKSRQRISITIQAVSGQDNRIRVLMTLIK